MGWLYRQAARAFRDVGSELAKADAFAKRLRADLDADRPRPFIRSKDSGPGLLLSDLGEDGPHQDFADDWMRT